MAVYQLQPVAILLSGKVRRIGRRKKKSAKARVQAPKRRIHGVAQQWRHPVVGCFSDGTTTIPRASTILKRTFSNSRLEVVAQQKDLNSTPSIPGVSNTFNGSTPHPWTRQIKSSFERSKLEQGRIRNFQCLGDFFSWFHQRNLSLSYEKINELLVGLMNWLVKENAKSLWTHQFELTILGTPLNQPGSAVQDWKPGEKPKRGWVKLCDCPTSSRTLRIEPPTFWVPNAESGASRKRRKRPDASCYWPSLFIMKHTSLSLGFGISLRADLCHLLMI